MSPPLSWSRAPSGAQSFALVADEPEHESGSWVHWVLFNIPAETTELPTGIPTSTDTLPDGTRQGTNDFKNLGYNGPCPDPIVIALDFIGNSTLAQKRPVPRVYQVTLYALDAMLDLAAGSSRNELVSAMKGHILGQAFAAGKFTASHGLDTKGGGANLQTVRQGTQTPSGEAAPSGEKIYNSLGELITPTPAGGQ